MIAEIKFGIRQRVGGSDKKRWIVATHVGQEIGPNAVKETPCEYIVEIGVCEAGRANASNRTAMLFDTESVDKPRALFCEKCGTATDGVHKSEWLVDESG